MSSNGKEVALIIGASRGIGRQVAIDLAKNGYFGRSMLIQRLAVLLLPSQYTNGHFSHSRGLRQNNLRRQHDPSIRVPTKPKLTSQHDQHRRPRNHRGRELMPSPSRQHPGPRQHPEARRRCSLQARTHRCAHLQ